MKVLFIGGTGLISSACSVLALKRGFDLTILNRGQSRKHPIPADAEFIPADAHDAQEMKQALGGRAFDVVVDWVAYLPEDVERDLALFAGRTRQFVFISSASAYQKPPGHYLITEATPLANPYWEYSRQKIACEARLNQAYRQQAFPVTIVRPSLTYGPSQIPLCVGSWQHPYTVVDRMKRGRPIIVPGDGTSLWVLTWNEDFATGLLGLLGREDAIGQVFHITSDEVLTWDQIYRETGRALGLELEIVHLPSDLICAYDPDSTGSLIGDKSNSAVFDNGKIKRFVPEFTAAVPWSEGVRRALAWHQAHPEFCTIDREADERWERTIAAYRRAIPGATPGGA
jgi:nucleoside-diphosphate-sugar epimerase